MTYLILCILSSTSIFLIFKKLGQNKIPSLPVIIINYLVASVFGFIINIGSFEAGQIRSAPWLPISILIGFLFIVMFFIIARSSATAGISVTTVASKMSVVFPIAYSILIDPNDRLGILKTIAILAALAGVLLTIYQPGKIASNSTKVFIPLILFFGMGIVDSLVKFAQHKFVSNDDAAIFSAVLFAMAFVSGLLSLPFNGKILKNFKSGKTWYWGIGLGIVNFGSIYLMVSALNQLNKYSDTLDSSIIFGINNIGIVSLSVLAGLLVFKEPLKPLNWLGISISVLAIILFAYV